MAQRLYAIAAAVFALLVNAGCVALCVCVLAGCAYLPQDGNVGISYCGADVPMGLARCPCGTELRISERGYDCVDLATGIRSQPRMVALRRVQEHERE